ncbi:Imm21 family immunity protein [Phytomonospora sp. NPDC050363]|uniref:Imm21 family immunity protein n=1 Tax=Phytomonospora sp. NPDC050363 TaxID=3155642 RepID=UPI0033F08101
MTEPMPSPIWVDSLGGPLIVLPATLLPDWRGSAAEDEPADADDDYERACAVDEYAAAIPVGDGEGLVLGDEPAMTCYLPEHRAFLRWIAADSETDLFARAAEVLADPTATWQDCGMWATDGPAVLMDSVYAGPELATRDTFGDLPAQATVPVPSGRWSVRVATDDRAPHTWLVLVRLDPAVP